MTDRDWRILRGFAWLWLGIGLGIAIGTACPRVQAQTPTQAEVVALIDQAAAEVGLSAWETQRARQIAWCESRFQSGAYNRASGAVGVFQWLPTTARAVGIDPWDVEQNVSAAMRLMRQGQWQHWRACW